MASLLRLATAGSVDDGKSTLIGRLLYDSKSLMADQVADAEVDLARLTDGLRAEREQGITIDVAYRFFATPERSFIIADTPGHVRYTRNMVTGASTADLAVVLVDARNGVLEQSRRHAYLSAQLGIKHIVACVNKMDLVDWDEERFRAIEREFGEVLRELGVEDATAIPISALHGDNVVDPSDKAPWYDGPPLLRHLEQVEVARDRNLEDVRFPVQWVIRATDYRGYAGQMASGMLRAGDEVVVLPGGDRTTVERVETLDGPVEVAYPPMSVVVHLANDIDAGRGSMICGAGGPPPVARRLDARLCWMTDAPLRPGARYQLKQTTRRVRATVESIDSKVDLSRLRDGEPAAELQLNDIGRVHLDLTTPIMAEPYTRNRVTGAFILIDEKSRDTVAAGTVLEAYEDPGPPTGPHSPGVIWHEPALPRRQRWSRLGLRGATVWLTGLPASGKSTIAEELERKLVALGRPAYLLDGENVRHGLSGDLGFSPADRSEHARRVASVARMFADAGLVTIVALVSPAAADRQWARQLHKEAGLEFVE
ncbi:MAG TPA: bifunctional sulfate adenylyltransferase subunit 1/adenylylsulfate kinase, partial [Solirubrobacteraceae bacterium]|nr:bifunctional sulfate adenylyltransferase subunit 1/adenylylsulfate kinase [Solirubrobacteraceae bacterium]